MHDVERFLDLVAPVVSAIPAQQPGTLAIHDRYSRREPALVDVDAPGEGAAGAVPDACRFGIGDALLPGPARV